MKNTIILVGAIAILFTLGGIGLFVQRAIAESQAVAFFGTDEVTILFTSDKSMARYDVAKLSSQDDLGSDRPNKELYLSPDRKYLAITYEPNEEHVFTYITDTNGNEIVAPQVGSFVSWSPDSKKVLLYLSIEKTGSARKIYYLGLDGTYENSGLPDGVISADVSPKDGSIVYALTTSASDDTNLFIRDNRGQDRLIVSGKGSILTWVRWSPSGDEFAYLKSNLWINNDEQTIWTSDPQGSRQQMISKIRWNYPPAWAPDGSNFAFANDGNIWEYHLPSSSLNNLTKFNGGTALHPSYSADGKTILFARSHSDSQIWAARGDVIDKITRTPGSKAYPIAP